MSHQHDHTHEHGHGCCGHDHSHEHKHECCGHGHAHDHRHEGCAHDHAHGKSCCGHSHGDDAWTRGFFTCLQGVVLITIGAVMCYFVASGRIDGRNPQTPYVTGWFKGLALCGGLGLIVMGVFNWITRRREVDCGHDHAHGEDGAEPQFHSHEGSVAGRALTLLVLSGSVAAAAMLTPDQLSSRYIQYKASAYGADRNSAERLKQVNPALAKASSGGLTLEKVKEYLKPDKDGNFPINVVNLHYMGGDPEYAAVMEGQSVVTTGQVVKDELNPGPGNLRVFTMQVTCCAADARPYSIPVVFEGPAPEYVEMGWYHVTGTIGFTQERGMKVAVVRAKREGGLQATVRPAPQGPSF